MMTRIGCISRVVGDCTRLWRGWETRPSGLVQETLLVPVISRSGGSRACLRGGCRGRWAWSSRLIGNSPSDNLLGEHYCTVPA